jgi:nitroimidazol reductase NimA-like FMN-containing flavoprotein (pyridoxamine 5'-phosphate oxidase superfamily)
MAMVDMDGNPYVIHMNFGYQDGTVFFHSAPEGRKIDILRINPQVCLSFSTDHLLRWQNIDVACSYSMKYRSVLIRGKAVFIDDYDQKEQALNVIMGQYTDEQYRYSEPAINNVCVFRVEAQSIEARAFGY